MKTGQKSKPSYAYAIIGVSLVLFLLGTLGWLVINGRSLTRSIAEGIVITANLHDNTREELGQKLRTIIADQSFTRTVRYVSKEQALKSYGESSGNEDIVAILDGANPLFPSIEINLRYDYVNTDSVNKIKAFLMQSNIVRSVTDSPGQISTVSSNFRKINLILGGLSLLLVIAVVVLIDNTVRLAMFSDRFLIKTMQMVGATRWFISKPFDQRAIVNGIISGLLAVGLLSLVIYSVENWQPSVRELHNTPMLVLLMCGIVLMGVVISLLSTHRSVVKYLKKPVDDLY